MSFWDFFRRRPQPVPPVPEPPAPPLPSPVANPLTIDPTRLCLMDDTTPFTHKGCLEWMVFGHFRVEGEAWLRTFLADRHSVGANTICFGTMLSWGPRMHPSEESWWTDLTRFVEILGEEGMRGVPIVFADTRPGGAWPGMPDRATQDAHWVRMLAHLGGFMHVNIILVANQPGHPSQADTMRPEDTLRFPKTFPHYLIIRDNPHEDSNPVLPAGDLSALCSTRNLHRYQQMGSSCWYVMNGWPEDPAGWSGSRVPVMLFEPPRIEAGVEYGIEARVSNGWDNPTIWWEMARSLAFRGTVGGNAYSRQGRNADLLTGVIRDCYFQYFNNIPRP